MSVIKEKMTEKITNDADVLEEKKEEFEKLIDNKNVEQFVEKENNTDIVVDSEKYKLCDDDRKGRKNLIIYFVVAVISLIIIFAAFMMCYNIFYKKIFSNMYIAGVEISNLTKDEAIKKLEEAFAPNLSREITLKHDNDEYKITPLEIGATYNYKQIVEEIYKIGRDGNIFENNISMIKSFFIKTNATMELTYETSKLNDVIEKVNSDFSGLVQSSYEILEDKVVIKKGSKGTEVKRDILKEKIIANIEEFGPNVIEFGVIVREPDAIDIDEIHDKIYKAPVDAYYTTNPFEIHEEESGVDFSISIDEAKSLLETAEGECIIQLKTLTPSITTAQIGTEAFPDLLATCTSPYIASKVGRTTNLKIASGKIDGYVLMPGDTFSYNSVVGKRTVAAGFQLAGVYSGGGVVDGLGGGICQISSTLYNIVVMSDLEIIERENHSFLPGYLPAGRDATVVYGAIDFKFKNTRDYPVKIYSTVSGGYVTMKMFGLKRENEPTITFETVYHQTIYPKTVYKDTTSLPEGQTKVETSGQNGCKSTTYKVVKQNGQVVSKTVLSTDTYSAMNKVVLRGIKSPEASSE